LDERVAESIGSTSKGVGNGWVHFWIVKSRVPSLNGMEAKSPHVLGPKYEWKELIVSNVLHFGNNDPPRLLINNLITPIGIECEETVGNSVVFSEPNCMKQSELNLFIHTKISGTEAEPLLLSIRALGGICREEVLPSTLLN
jgi:hypothetical protein